jgi:hypothetical protein
LQTLWATEREKSYFDENERYLRNAKRKLRAIGIAKTVAARNSFSFLALFAIFEMAAFVRSVADWKGLAERKAFEEQIETALGRRLLKRSNGYIGLGPAGTKVGDVICLVEGGHAVHPPSDRQTR